MKFYLYHYSYLFLQSRYKFVFYFLVYLLILYFTKGSWVWCMNNGSEIPLVAEAKPILSHQGLALKKSIIDYAGDLENSHKTIVEQKKIIATQERRLNKQAQIAQQSEKEFIDNAVARGRARHLTYIASEMAADIKDQQAIIARQRTAISDLEKELAFKEQCYKRLGSEYNKINRLLSAYIARYGYLDLKYLDSRGV